MSPALPDCGLFNDVSQEAFINILERCGIHSRLVLTEFVNKVCLKLESCCRPHAHEPCVLSV